MISDYRCFYCFTRAFGKLIEKENLSVEAKNDFTHEMVRLYANVNSNFSAPKFSRELHEILKNYTNNPDPYFFEKKESNDIALNLYPSLKNQVLESDDPFNKALRLAIAGNIMDYSATNGDFDIYATIEQVLNSNFAIDHSEMLKSSLQKAKTVLYLGDNAGEIVFDKLFIEKIMHPHLFFAVRGGPVINDITIDDAKYTGMDIVADIISNGYNAPSTIIEHCSPEFQEVFEQADVVISKGQGNLEGLLSKTNKDVFYLLMVKCNVIADALKVNKGDFVVFNEKYK